MRGSKEVSMKTQEVILMERRLRPREGVIAEIENLTYSVLRRYGINGPAEQPSLRTSENAA
jgi:hypothetical protein